MRLVLDCSVAASWVFEDENEPLADVVLEALLDGQALVPLIWPVELASILMSGVRRRRLAVDQIETRMAPLKKLDIRIEEFAVDPPLLARVALESGLSVYDAMYLDLARKHALPLATLDRKLAASAAQAGVRLFKSAA